MKLHSKDLLVGLSEFFKIFGDATRLRILDVLLNGEKCVNEISETLNVSQSAISHQLKNLRTSNLVKTKKLGKIVKYSIADNHIKIILEYGLEHIMEEVKNEKI
ncbi:MAG: winged helix-turn-helix transcriptional regulator [Bacilli bacterium]|nr:winged helix-turn-helix transcriptional regulator [Bacilli bacterium]MCI9434095.1 winged helix-turn-helix transcriptional regulator [Bacilli bacterium]